MGKHRTPDGEKSTSEKIQGKRNDASKSEHREGTKKEGRLGFSLGSRKDAPSKYVDPKKDNGK